MSTAPQPPRDDDPDLAHGESTEAGRRRGRLLIPAVFIAGIVLIFLFILLVSQLNQ
ncbi:hypothetical protein [Candidatus Blastococcus massiliensis]|uniref:hypothetical protein n=1 Tax=Candidatus Blastococcus massiliensis TaxID=1470358 RepID=UPI0004B21D5D|nr:hypothetical protein [Candidatus Blastococcus massiliensis]